MNEAGDISNADDSENDYKHNRINEILESSGQFPLSSQQLKLFSNYLALILRWNARMNLTAIRTEEGIVSRHFVESIACARAIPSGVRTLLDFGSGAGFPGIPIAICRPEMVVTLAESQGKKAAFLQEALRELRLSAAVYHGRAEELSSEFDCVVLRAVDNMKEAVASASGLVSSHGLLALMTTEGEFAGLREAAGLSFTWDEPIKSPGSESQILALGRRSI